jgi:hypothetical protein
MMKCKGIFNILKYFSFWIGLDGPITFNAIGTVLSLGNSS